MDEPDTGKHSDDRDGEGADEFEGKRGEEGDPQGGHGLARVGVRKLAQRLGLFRCAAEAHQYRQSFGQFKQVVGQARQRGHSSLGFLLGMKADQDHKQRHKRDGKHDHHRADPVRREDSGADQQRHDCAGNQRREVLGVIGVEAVQPTGEQDSERTGPARGSGGVSTVLDEPAEGRLPEPFLYSDGQPVRRRFLPPGGAGAQQYSGHSPHQSSRDIELSLRQRRNPTSHGLGEQHQPRSFHRSEHPQQIHRPPGSRRPSGPALEQAGKPARHSGSTHNGTTLWAAGMFRSDTRRRKTQ